MEVRYNAFISYRHHPQDIRVATQIHRMLERFKVPKALKKKTGGITRLFRDKDELPITSNLSEDITSALKNSDYLIVICSTHTKESVWVQREIETFLQTHDRSKVLTVLVDGEPYEVIPEILLYETKIDPQTGEEKRIALEPLSCDWRVGTRKARREELPRLAAALLHCSYDELRQRQKQYRLHRLLAFGSVALAASLGLMAYFLYTSITIRNANVRIQENYLQALKNQSQYLSTAAQELLNEGDRMTALALLLEAVPREGADRPYVAAAEEVLTEALGVYNTSGGVVARGALMPDASALIEDFLRTEDGCYLYLLDSRDIVTVWDDKTLMKIATIDPGMEIRKLFGITAEGNLLVPVSEAGDSALRCYQPDGTMLWQVEGYIMDVAFQDEKKTVVLQTRNEEYAELVLLVDSLTGAALRDPILLPAEIEDSRNHYFLQQQYASGMPLLMEHHGYDWKESYVYLLNPDTGEYRYLLEQVYSPDQAITTEDGNVILMISDGSGWNNGYLLDMVTSSPMRFGLYCLDMESGEQLWESELVTYQYTGSYTLQQVPDGDLIFCHAGNTFQLISGVDGQVLQRCEAASGICSNVNVTGTGASGITSDGGYVLYSFAENQCNAIYYGIVSDLKQAYVGGGLYVSPKQDSRVIAYQWEDPAYLWEDSMDDTAAVLGAEEEARFQQLQAQEDAMGGSASENADPELTAQLKELKDQIYKYTRGDLYVSDRWIAREYSDKLWMYDLQSHKYVWQQDVGYPFSVLGFSQDGTLLWAKEDVDQLTAYEVASGAKQTYQIPQKWKDNYLIVCGDYLLWDDKVWYAVKLDQTLYLATLTPETGDVAYQEVYSTGLEVPDEFLGCAGSKVAMEILLGNNSYPQDVLDKVTLLMDSCDAFYKIADDTRVLTVSEGYAWVLTGDGTLYTLPLTGEAPTQVAMGLSEPVFFACRESDGLMAIAGGTKSVLLCSADGQLLQQLEMGEEEAPGSLYFRGEELLVLTDQGRILRFDAEGSLLSRTGIMVYASLKTELHSVYHTPADLGWYETEDGYLIQYAFGLANIIHCETWEYCAYVRCEAYLPDEDVFLRRDEGPFQAFHRYSLDELIQKAEQFLGDYTLTKEEREAYGID